jgi:hypothetical protein
VGCVGTCIILLVRSDLWAAAGHSRRSQKQKRSRVIRCRRSTFSVVRGRLRHPPRGG